MLDLFLVKQLGAVAVHSFLKFCCYFTSDGTSFGTIMPQQTANPKVVLPKSIWYHALHVEILHSTEWSNKVLIMVVLVYSLSVANLLKHLHQPWVYHLEDSIVIIA